MEKYHKMKCDLSLGVTREVVALRCPFRYVEHTCALMHLSKTYCRVLR